MQRPTAEIALGLVLVGVSLVPPKATTEYSPEPVPVKVSAAALANSTSPPNRLVFAAVLLAKVCVCLILSFV